MMTHTGCQGPKGGVRPRPMCNFMSFEDKSILVTNQIKVGRSKFTI